MLKRLIPAILFAISAHAQMDDYPWIGQLDPSISQGLVGYWSFQNGTAIDNFGSNNGNQSNGASVAWASGYNGSGAAFDGANDYIDFPSSPVYFYTNAPMSFCAWVNLKGFVTNQYPTIALLKSNIAGQSFILGASSNASYLGFLIGANSGVTNLKTSTSVATMLSGWHHVAFTYNGAGSKTVGNYAFYVDAVPTTLSGAPGFAAATNTTMFGGKLAATAWMEGWLDEVRIYSNVLNNATISNIVQRGRWLNPIGR